MNEGASVSWMKGCVNEKTTRSLGVGWLGNGLQGFVEPVDGGDGDRRILGVGEADEVWLEKRRAVDDRDAMLAREVASEVFHGFNVCGCVCERAIEELIRAQSSPEPFRHVHKGVVALVGDRGVPARGHFTAKDVATRTRAFRDAFHPRVIAHVRT